MESKVQFLPVGFSREAVFGTKLYLRAALGDNVHSSPLMAINTIILVTKLSHTKRNKKQSLFLSLEVKGFVQIECSCK